MTLPVRGHLILVATPMDSNNCENALTFHETNAKAQRFEAAARPLFAQQGLECIVDRVHGEMKMSLRQQKLQILQSDGRRALVASARCLVLAGGGGGSTCLLSISLR